MLNWTAKQFSVNGSYSIILALNQESMLIDPIQWDDFKKALLLWGEENNLNLNIPDLTDNLFNERTPLTHSSRLKCETSFSCASGVYNFFDPTCVPKRETNHLLLHGIPIKLANLIAKINSHNRSLSMIGFLPNQLRVLLKQVNQIFFLLNAVLFLFTIFLVFLFTLVYFPIVGSNIFPEV